MITLDPEALPEALDALRQRLRTFIEDELLPVERQRGLADAHRASPDLRRWVRQRSRALGLFALFQPRALGGGGLGPLGLAALHETVAASGSALAHFALGDDGGLLALGTAEQRERLLGPVLRGELTAAFAFTDAREGPRTLAVRRGDAFVVTGVKSFVTGGPAARSAAHRGPGHRECRRPDGHRPVRHSPRCAGRQPSPRTEDPGRRGPRRVRAARGRRADRRSARRDRPGSAPRARAHHHRAPARGRRGVRHRRLGPGAHAWPGRPPPPLRRAPGRARAGPGDAGRRRPRSLRRPLRPVLRGPTRGGGRRRRAGRGHGQGPGHRRGRADRRPRHAELTGGAAVVEGHPLEALYRRIRGWRIAEGTTEVLRLVIARGLLADHRARGERR